MQPQIIFHFIMFETSTWYSAAGFESALLLLLGKSCESKAMFLNFEGTKNQAYIENLIIFRKLGNEGCCLLSVVFVTMTGSICKVVGLWRRELQTPIFNTLETKSFCASHHIFFLHVVSEWEKFPFQTVSYVPFRHLPFYFESQLFLIKKILFYGRIRGLKAPLSFILYMAAFSQHNLC